MTIYNAFLTAALLLMIFTKTVPNMIVFLAFSMCILGVRRCPPITLHPICYCAQRGAACGLGLHAFMFLNSRQPGGFHQLIFSKKHWQLADLQLFKEGVEASVLPESFCFRVLGHIDCFYSFLRKLWHQNTKF